MPAAPDALPAAVQEFYAARSAAEKREKVERFRRLNRFARPGQIVFAGSSLMEQFPIYEFLQDFDLPLTVYNRGVGGFTTAELLEVLDPCIFDLKPRVLVLNIGTNDLNGPDYSQEQLLANYAEILTRIRQSLPDVKLLLLAYYPVNPTVADNPYMQGIFKYRTNARIAAASAGVRELAAKYGAQFLDLNAGITDANGNLKAEYTVEGMHMYADGYKPVLDALLPALTAAARAAGLLPK